MIFAPPTVPGFEFREAEHTYWIEGQRLPGFSEIAKAERWVDDSFYTEEARDRGSAVHDAGLLLLQGMLNFGALDKRWKGYLLSLADALGELEIEPILVEIPLASRSFRFAGKFDLLARIRKAIWLIDIKTGGPQDWHSLQLAAYHILLAENRIELGIGDRMPTRHANLYLSGDGKPGILKPIQRPIAEEIKAWGGIVTSFYRRGGLENGNSNGNGSGDRAAA